MELHTTQVQSIYLFISRKPFQPSFHECEFGNQK
jgi:hypothetical protein